MMEETRNVHSILVGNVVKRGSLAVQDVLKYII